ncbi:uncharacterized protein PADG_11420 [Paracoccidioides brasiliensis Pb18]|uniref:Uncharacterized protein n=1 Tax=Paracoccidioides brasiliensis (strain Pb18) TaxID=502780 RepID=A0A0A0HW39_PARBD|nr:uncharacterized protein PADG_11420 [Paracoccidioides brasiliensis Pb18]KGM92236.1 hypothetical protein PADG_11420 [Paracoccidioides brasiliensis Pb18]ODH52467.1 hypothetical protein GX48_01247 [Paracoccidioides brasiliensis]
MDKVNLAAQSTVHVRAVSPQSLATKSSSSMFLEIEKSRVDSSTYDNYPCLSAFSSSNFFTFIVVLVLVLSHDSTPDSKLKYTSYLDPSSNP